MKNLEGIETLKDLRLSGSLVGDSGLESLKGLKNLSSLDLRHELSARGLEHLAGLPIEKLVLRGTRDNVLKLDSLPYLRYLDLTGSYITDASLKQSTGLGGLSYLSLADTWITDAGLECLKGMHELMTLDLCNTMISGASLGCLSGMKDLSKVRPYENQAGRRRTAARCEAGERGKPVSSGHFDYGRRASLSGRNAGAN